MLRNKYTFIGLIKLTLWYIRTKLFYPKARLIRFPFDVRGKKNIQFGVGLTTGIGCRIEAFAEKNKKVLIFGNNVQINDYVHISAMNNISIGNNVLMASKIYISDCSHGSYKGDENDSSPLLNPINRAYSKSFINIKNNVWIGEFVSILPGVTIGEGSLIGANSVVTSDVPDFCIAVGVPARIIKRFDFKTNTWIRVKN